MSQTCQRVADIVESDGEAAQELGVCRVAGHNVVVNIQCSLEVAERIVPAPQAYQRVAKIAETGAQVARELGVLRGGIAQSLAETRLRAPHAKCFGKT